MTIGSVLRSRLDQRSDEALANRAAMEALWDEVAEQIRESLRNRATFKARRDLVQQLKSAASIERKL